MSRIVTLSAFAIVVATITGAPLAAQAHLVSVPCCGFQDAATGNNKTFVSPGTVVQWNRVGITPHTVTSGTGPTDPTVGMLFNGSLAGATTTFSQTFPSLGTFPYFCSFHFAAPMNMIGTVYVLPAASATVVGTGCNASTGQLVLGTTGLPKVGNATFGFTLSGGPVGAPAYLYLSFGTGPAVQITPTCFAYIDVNSAQQLIAAGSSPVGPQNLGGGGTTTFTFPLPFDPSFGGLSGAVQALVYDAAAPGGAGFALSNAVAIVVGA